MRQTIFLFALVAVATVAMAVAASAECRAIGANNPASVYTSCAAPLPVEQHQTALPVATSCGVATPVATSCGVAAPVASSCAAPAGFYSATGTQRWGADLIVVPGFSDMSTACGPAPPLPQGRADFQLTPQGDVLRYWVNVTDINGVDGAEIRLAGPGDDIATAPVVATLYGGPVRTVSGSSRLSRGDITCADLMGPLQGKPVSALLDALTSGHAVVVVDTTAHPRGEIAGIPGCSNLG